jgi:hypothetical protein
MRGNSGSLATEAARSAHIALYAQLSHWPRVCAVVSSTTTQAKETIMKKIRIENYLVASLLGLSVGAFLATAYSASLSGKDKQFLAGYEKVHAALVADDLAGVKKAAADLGPDGADLGKSDSLEEARDAFEKLTAQAKQLASGQSGYHVFHCPMLKKDWVQTSTTIANPYGGKEMASCGEIQK